MNNICSISQEQTVHEKHAGLLEELNTQLEQMLNTGDESEKAPTEALEEIAKQCLEFYENNSEQVTNNPMSYKEIEYLRFIIAENRLTEKSIKKMQTFFEKEIIQKDKDVLEEKLQNSEKKINQLKGELDNLSKNFDGLNSFSLEEIINLKDSIQKNLKHGHPLVAALDNLLCSTNMQNRLKLEKEKIDFSSLLNIDNKTNKAMFEELNNEIKILETRKNLYSK